MTKNRANHRKTMIWPKLTRAGWPKNFEVFFEQFPPKFPCLFNSYIDLLTSHAKFSVFLFGEYLNIV